MLRAFRGKTPHAGYRALLDIIERLDLDYFVLTSNIDRYFERAGFRSERVCESHGNLEFLQCTSVGSSHPCTQTVWPISEQAVLQLDRSLTNTGPSLEDVPKCPTCGKIARPNVSHVTDCDDDIDFTAKAPKMALLKAWLRDGETAISQLTAKPPRRLVVLEVGCGDSIHSLRTESSIVVERFLRAHGNSNQCFLIRIDPASCAVPKDFGVPIQSTALKALCSIRDRIVKRGSGMSWVACPANLSVRVPPSRLASSLL